jgi:hypothetical protein
MPRMRGEGAGRRFDQVAAADRLSRTRPTGMKRGREQRRVRRYPQRRPTLGAWTATETTKRRVTLRLDSYRKITARTALAGPTGKALQGSLAATPYPGLCGALT